MKICGTGHRPKSLGPDGYSKETFNQMVEVAGAWLDDHPEVTEVISGMALGWDQALAVAALNRLLPVHAYIPFPGQADKWPLESQYFYQDLLRQCSSIKMISFGGYSAKAMQDRNEAMVDDSAEVLALWSGEPGGTANAVTYAENCLKVVHNVWDHFCLLL